MGKAKSFAITLSETVADTRQYLGTEDFKWRALITTGRYATHSMIVLAGVAAILLASFKVGSAAPQAIVVTPTKNASVAQQGFGSISDGALQNVSMLTSPGRGGSNGNKLFTVGGPGQGNPDQARAAGAQGLSPYVGISNVDSALLTRQIVLAEEKPVEARAAIQTYMVQTGDTIEGIASKFNLQPTTVIWSNDDVEKSPDHLAVGQVLNILPVNGIYYTVEQNDSLSGIAGEFKVTVEDIINSPLNKLQGDSQLQPGMQIVIPNGVKQWKQQEIANSVPSNSGRQSAATTYSAPQAPSYSGSGNFGWPTAASMVSQGFWWGHRGLDIAASIGVPIYASESGYVSYAGWNNTGYGNMIMLSHGGGFETLYGHLSEWYVDPGQYVSKGQLIGAMGSTGNSTGPHVHFEIRVNGTPSNPYFYLQ